MDSSQILYNSIFNLPQDHSQITSVKLLIDSIQQIIAQIKTLKAENRSQQIQKKCFKNKKLVYVSKIMKQNYYRVYDIWEQSDDPLNVRNLAQIDLFKKQSVPMSIYSNPSGHVLANSRLMITKYEYKLKYLLISMFYNMLVNEKMITFLNSMSVPFHVYVMLLRSLTLCGRSCLRYKQTQKCLKFIYNYIKITKENIPKVYLHLIKNFLQLYHKNYEVQFIFDSNIDNRERIKLCYSYIFQISMLVLRKNLFLASKCGILSLLYHKCIEGVFTNHKVQLITQTIITYCVQQKTRLIIYSTIDLGKTFAIFTNIDMVQSINQKNDRMNTKSDPAENRSQMKKKDSLTSCAIMIQMYLSNWPTLIYFLQQIKTLDNFIISLKRKEDQELIMLNQIIFSKIMMRCINYNRKKIMKSNNLFNIQSNYLIIKSLMVLNFFFKHQDFKKLLYSHSCMIEIRQNFTQILLEYFISNDQQYKNKDFSKILINNIRNINYYKKINTDFSKKGTEQKGVVNNNIQSYYTQSLLPFEFNVQQLKSYLFKILRVIQEPKSKELISKLLSDIAIKYQDNKQLEEKQLLEFYKLGMSILQQIQWLDKYLDISKYLSSILSHLRSSKSIIDISQKCRQYIKNIFENPQNKYFQYLSINILDDIGRYFYSDNKVIQYLNGYISDNIQAYKISRILLHINYQRNNNQSIDGPQKVYSQISKRGSRALILQIIEIIKYSCQQNDNRFLNQHLQILFTLIYVDDQDIVYSIIELLEQFVNKSKELQDYILKIDVKKIKHWNKRVFYLFLHVENPVLSIKQTLSPNFLKEQLERWESDENRKKTYYLFTLRELKKFTQDSILSTDYLNLGLDPANYRKLIFLPWNIKINDEFHAIFIEYKNLQDKLKLKIYLNIIIMKEIIIQQLYIGAHNYTKYIQPKVGFQKKQQDSKIRLTLEQIKKEHQNKGRDCKKFVMQRQQAIFFINYEQGIYKIERININIPLTLDTYRPLSHPLNYINLLCRKQMGYQFLKKQKFIEHCLEIIKNDQPSSISKQQYNGALVCLGTLCASKHMQINEKIEIYQIITKKFLSSKNYQIQEICFWIINILIRHHVVRNRVKNYLILIQTKRCEWICLPDISALEKRTIDFKQRISNNLRYVRDNLPEKLQNDAFKYLSNILNDNLTKDEQSSSRYKETFESGNIDGRVLESIIKYVSVIDFTPIKIYQAVHKLAYYIVSDKFQQDYPIGFWLS